MDRTGTTSIARAAVGMPYACAGLALAAMISLGTTACLAQSPEPATAATASDGGDQSKSAPGLSLGPRPATPESRLARMRDAGIPLNEIRQQSLNIFLEATRPQSALHGGADLTVPTSISVKDLKPAGTYLTPRPEWLTFYVGAMEPLIQLFSQGVEQAKAGGSTHQLSPEAEEKLAPLKKQWRSGVDELNNHLAQLYNLIGTAPNIDNLAVAREAVAMFQTTEEMDRARQKAFKIVREESLESE